MSSLIPNLSKMMPDLSKLPLSGQQLFTFFMNKVSGVDELDKETKENKKENKEEDTIDKMMRFMQSFATEINSPEGKKMMQEGINQTFAGPFGETLANYAEKANDYIQTKGNQLMDKANNFLEEKIKNEKNPEAKKLMEQGQTELKEAQKRFNDGCNESRKMINDGKKSAGLDAKSDEQIEKANRDANPNAAPKPDAKAKADAPKPVGKESHEKEGVVEAKDVVDSGRPEKNPGERTQYPEHQKEENEKHETNMNEQKATQEAKQTQEATATSTAAAKPDAPRPNKPG